MRLGRRLRQLRSARDLSQAELGMPHFDRRYVSAVELATIMPSLGALLHFARTLRVSLSILLRDVDPPISRPPR